MNTRVEIIFTGQDVFRVHKSAAVLPSIVVHRPKSDVTLSLSVGQRGDYSLISSEQVDAATKFAVAAAEFAKEISALYMKQKEAQLEAAANVDYRGVQKHARF